MLYIVLVLVLAAFGLLIAALTTANTVWAWISVAVSVVAAALLIMDWLRGRRRAATEPATDAQRDEGPLRNAQRDEGPLHRTPADLAPAEALPAEPLPLADLPLADVPLAGQPPAEQRLDEPLPVQQSVDEPPPAGSPAGESGEPVVAESVAPPPETPAETTIADDLGDPAEEPTDAADLLIVAGLSIEVRVVDEHPRYHLTTCTWLAGQATIPIAVSEARQLGFTPCVRCGPDARLAAKHRADR